MAESSGRPCLCRSEKEPVAAGQIMEVFFFKWGQVGGNLEGARGGEGGETVGMQNE